MGDEFVSSTIAEKDGLPSWLGEIEELDIEEGLLNSGSADAYLSILHVFHQMAKSKNDEIRDLYNAGDIKGYTIKVHALKSSARIIGNKSLSALAEKLEMAGKSSDIDFVKANTGQLLENYRVFDEKLAPLDEQNESLPPIEQSELKEAYETIFEIARVMDYGMMEGMLRMLRGYRLEPSEAQRVAEMEMQLTLLDWDGIIRTAQEAFESL